MKELFDLLDQLIYLLENRGSSSATFFENSKKNLETNSNDIRELDNLIRCYAITQYANFSKAEENLLEQLISVARKKKKEVI